MTRYGVRPVYCLYHRVHRHRGVGLRFHVGSYEPLLALLHDTNLEPRFHVGSYEPLLALLHDTNLEPPRCRLNSIETDTCLLLCGTGISPSASFITMVAPCSCVHVGVISVEGIAPTL
jgi:hypothetical protein